ncbi:hypothetical protein TNIN_264511 [Trichonephila inaurata madagascariensis]|uniref:Uncharacterized protein n=1 Tax=Trichonephila inaurata madagascariensis TaxID=2747483 RepID=A0A8X6IUD0_9ARAC|nr:hypothetical protein TNIN_264511 [Trichonephila inaurata madagascariensis]
MVAEITFGASTSCWGNRQSTNPSGCIGIPVVYKTGIFERPKCPLGDNMGSTYKSYQLLAGDFTDLRKRRDIVAFGVISFEADKLKHFYSF